MRLRVSMECTLSTSPAEEKDLGNLRLDTIADTFRDGGSMRFRVPAGAVNQNVQHPQVAVAAYLFLRSESLDPTLPPVELLVRRNASGGEAWPLTPIDAKTAHMHMSTSGLTSLLISNPGLTDMALTVAMAGD